MKAQKYFISFSDKNNNTYSINTPSAFLSQRAIDRRNKQQIAITAQDLPVTPSYVDSVKKMGVGVLWASKWFNGLVVESNNQLLMDTITKVSFITNTQLIWTPTTASASKFRRPEDHTSPLKSAVIYGSAWNQTQTVNGQYLHQNNFEGENMVIAVLDNGFNSVNTLSAFTHLWNDKRILSHRDIVDPDSDIFATDSHGTNVLSIMGGLVDAEFKGSAPKASYHLIRTEDNSSECPIEEYNWVIGAEYADSIGADIINSSLGYNVYDGDFTDYTYADMDGETTVVVQGAEIAFSKGMVVINSAGNEGYNTWNKIISPAEGKNVLAVAAMTTDSIRASFSSFGPSYDGRVKPDVAAVGMSTALQSVSGELTYANGTSFAAPVITGFVACLWQALPHLKNTDLMQLIQSQAHQFALPDDSFGYGIPNFKTALELNNSIHIDSGGKLKAYPNPFDNYLNIHSTNRILANSIAMYDVAGNKVYQQQHNKYLPLQINELEHLPRGIYLLQIKEQSNTYTIKIIKK